MNHLDDVRWTMQEVVRKAFLVSLGVAVLAACATPQGARYTVGRGTASSSLPAPQEPVAKAADICPGTYIPTDEAVMLYERGEALEKAADLVGAAAAYESALTLAPNFVKPNMALSWIRGTASDTGIRNGKESVRLAERAFECMIRHLNERPVRDAFPAGYSRFEAIQVGVTLGAAYASIGYFDPVPNAATLREASGDQATAYSIASTHGDGGPEFRGLGAIPSTVWAQEASNYLYEETCEVEGAEALEAQQVAELQSDIAELLANYRNKADATGRSRPGWFEAGESPQQQLPASQTE